MKKTTNNFAYAKGVTHSGNFHADDVFSVALLRMINPDIEISRVRDVPDDIEDDVIVFDIGKGRYDHHQVDAAVRENGVKYAAFGLLWKSFGHLLVSESHVDKLDETFVQFIDKADNGVEFNPLSGAISAFVPAWDEDTDMDTAFWQAVSIADTILRREVGNLQSQERAANLVHQALKESDGQVVVLGRYLPWHDILPETTALFVVFPSNRGGYNLQCVPPEAGSFEKKVPLPAEWAGKSVQELSEFLPGLSFCHPGRFICGADTVETAVKAARMAMEIANA